MVGNVKWLAIFPMVNEKLTGVSAALRLSTV